MLRTWLRHLRQNVVSYLALFVALTGTAYAAGPLKPGDPAGGDLAGTYPNPTLKGCPAGQILKSDGSAWQCAPDAGVTTFVHAVVTGEGPNVIATCPPGTKLVGGGGGAGGDALQISMPVTPTEFAVRSTSHGHVAAIAICAS